MSIVSTIRSRERFVPFSIIALGYTISYGLSLLNSGVYWDDWILVDQRAPVILDMFKDASGAAGYITGPLHILMLALPHSVFIYRFFTFLLFLLSGYCLYLILEQVPEIEYRDRFMLVLFFVLLPLNAARISLITFHYTLRYFMFFVAFLLYVKYHRNLCARTISLILFFLSFFTNSIVLFYVVFLLFMFYYERDDLTGARLIGKIVLSSLDYILLPLVFVFVKYTYFIPSGAYTIYNKIQPATIEGVLGKFLFVFKTSFQGLLAVHGSLLSVFAVLIMACWIIYVLRVSRETLKNDKYDFIFLGIGGIAYITATVPYLLVGAQPSYDDWQSRHQLLMPLGTSFILYYGSKISLSRLNISRSALYVVVAFLALTFIMTNFLQQVEYTKDWFKQISLMGNLESSKVIQDHTTFFFDDNIPQYNANGRTYRFYEYAGFMKKVFHDETRFGISRQEFRNFGSMDALTPYFNAQYNLKDYKAATVDYTVSINPGPRTLTWNEYLRLSYYSLFQIGKFQGYAKALTNLALSKN